MKNTLKQIEDTTLLAGTLSNTAVKTLTDWVKSKDDGLVEAVMTFGGGKLHVSSSDWGLSGEVIGRFLMYVVNVNGGTIINGTMTNRSGVSFTLVA